MTFPHTVMCIISIPKLPGDYPCVDQLPTLQTELSCKNQLLGNISIKLLACPGCFFKMLEMLLVLEGLQITIIHYLSQVSVPGSQFLFFSFYYLYSAQLSGLPQPHWVVNELCLGSFSSPLVPAFVQHTGKLSRIQHDQ